MFTELNERLKRVKEKERNHSKWQERLTVLNRERTSQERSVQELEREWLKEHEDVEKLRNGSLSGFILTILNKKAERLLKEEMESVQAKAKHEAAIASVRFTQEEIRTALERIAEASGWEEEYEQIIRDKERLLKEHSPQTAEQMDKLVNRRIVLSTENQELVEAIHAGRALLIPLVEAEKCLNSARNWGTYDMLGGGFLSTHIKHGKIEESTEFMHSARGHLSRFEKELKDVNMILTVEFDVSSFLKFADYFFDGFFSDWIVQGKINDSLDQVAASISKVEDAISSLERLIQTRNNEIKQVSQDLTELIESVQA
ncbi:MAG: hypothetical protein K6T85_05860 [Gorillibacterium sp.]|nr:hypothetical protein [Gorillibacterium sp.]